MQSSDPWLLTQLQKAGRQTVAWNMKPCLHCAVMAHQVLRAGLTVKSITWIIPTFPLTTGADAQNIASLEFSKLEEKNSQTKLNKYKRHAADEEVGIFAATGCMGYITEPGYI